MKVFCSLSASVASISGINYCFKCSLIGKSEIVIGDKRCTIEEAACPLNSWIVKKKCLFFSEGLQGQFQAFCHPVLCAE